MGLVTGENNAPFCFGSAVADTPLYCCKLILAKRQHEDHSESEATENKKFTAKSSLLFSV